MKKRIISCLILVLIVFGGAVAYAQDSKIEIRASDVIDEGTVSLVPNGTTLSAHCNVVAKGLASQIGIMSLKIQKYEGGKWTLVKSFSNYKQNTITYAATYTCNGASGNRYRAVCKFYAMVNGASDTLICYSDTVTT